MISCPWCGAQYDTYQPNCQRCGGLIPAESGKTAPSVEASPTDGCRQMPPPAPRPIDGSYAWRLLLTDAWAIGAFVFCILGATFLLVGFPFMLGIATALFGIMFAGIGLVFLVGGAAVAAWRYQKTAKIVGVLRAGEAVEGQIVQVEKILYIRFGTRRPLAIDYQFAVNGHKYAGQVRTFNLSAIASQPGQRVCVLYLPQDPQWNVLYPHP